ncbi:MAG: hypothetical protein GY710_23890 [Desulfobacteraceae bacterium]|nr:hypothetical protein [Desulfobacteraceae bacterium]
MTPAKRKGVDLRAIGKVLPSKKDTKWFFDGAYMSTDADTGLSESSVRSLDGKSYLKWVTPYVKAGIFY